MFVNQETSKWTQGSKLLWSRKKKVNELWKLTVRLVDMFMYGARDIFIHLSVCLRNTAKRKQQPRQNCHGYVILLST